jgi:hypothetical protein
MRGKNNSLDVCIPRLIIKVVLLLILINFCWIIICKLPIGKISLYNKIYNGRLRLPYGENPSKSYNLSLYDIDAMFASHIISDRTNKKEKKLKIAFVGDSSIWGFLQQPDETLTGLLEKEYSTRDENISFFNFGYPSISVLKDILLIEKLKDYQPDLIVWFTTLEALPNKSQLNNPLVENNPKLVNEIIEKYEMKNISNLPENGMQKILLNQVRNIANLLNLQLYGIHWTATGIDQEYPESYQEAQRDFEELKKIFHGISQNDDGINKYLEFEIIRAGIEKNPDIDFILINEPVLISEGENSAQQYNFYYPKWAYDLYREEMDSFTHKNNIKYYDFWNLIPQTEFTNSAIHLSRTGEKILADEISKIVDQYLESIGVNEKS